MVVCLVLSLDLSSPCLVAVEVIRNNLAVRQQLDLRLYLDVIPDATKPDIPPGSITVFLKQFDTSKQTLCGVGKVYVLRSSKVGDLVPLINERMRWPPGTPLKLYEVKEHLNHQREGVVLTDSPGNQTGHD